MFKEILTDRKDLKRFSQKEEILTKKIYTDNQRFRQIKISACN